MAEPHEPDAGVRARLVLVDPDTLSVTWLNEAAREALPHGADLATLAVADIAELTADASVADVVTSVASDGEPRHLRTRLVSMARGSITVVTSVYPLPSGEVLVVTENAWEQKPSDRSSGGSGRHRRR